MDNVRIEETDKSIDWKDQYVKLLADYENAKKRVESRKTLKEQLKSR
jgi:molecular chaperone GrpE (heat shock protein)